MIDSAIDDANIRLADLVTDHLNSASLGFTAKRGYVPRHELASLAESELRVVVVPKSEESQIASRSALQVDRVVDVAVVKKLGRGTSDTFDRDALDELMRYPVSQIKERLVRSKLDQFTWIRSAHDPIYSPDHLKEQRVWLSLISVTYRVLE